MGDTILFRRGTFANLPALQEGEPGWCTDIETLFIGGAEGSVSGAVRIGGYEIDALTYLPNTFTQATIQAALTAIGTSTKATLLLRPGTWVISSNANWSAYTNVTFKIVPGAVISHGAFTINIPNAPTDVTYQWLSGTGLVTFGGVHGSMFPHIFGALSDGTNATATTTAINAAFTSGNDVFFPEGDYAVNGTITVLDKVNPYIHGMGEKSRLLWQGVLDDQFVLLYNSHRVNMEKLWLYNNDPATAPSSMIESTNNVATLTVNNTENIFRDLVIGGSVSDSIKIGIRYTFIDTSWNNDQALFEKVTIQNYSVAAVSLEHQNSKAHTFIDCKFQSGPVGILTNAEGGSFRWYGGMMSGHTDADFSLGRINDTILISGLNSEGSNRLLTQTTGGLNTGWPILIEGIRWASNGMNADGKFIHVWGGTPLVLTGNQFGGPGGIVIPKIWVDSVAGGNQKESLVSIGNHWYIAQSTDPPPTPYNLGADAKLVSLGNVMATAVTPGTFYNRRIPDIIGSATTLTLAANAATTVVSDINVSASSIITITPTSATAAADQGSATGVWISAKSAGVSFTVTHPSNANADKTFNYMILN